MYFRLLARANIVKNLAVQFIYYITKIISQKNVTLVAEIL